jgi:predicted O-linked N-acetylglucosamine transferase (SPINDLY family)
VSGDFRRHSVSFFIEPILAHHDKSQFEIFCYANQQNNDAVTERLRGYGHQWRDIFGKSDETAAELIQHDQIDILIDLSLHTGGTRLLMFARKPAPIQGTYLGYAGTSGLAAIDFRLTDAWIDPIGSSEPYNSERLVRLPDTQWVYRPPIEVPEVGPLPAHNSGQITFGIATNLAKMNTTTVELWSRVMSAVPGSVLVLKGAGLADVPENPDPGISPVAQYRGRRYWELVRRHFQDLFASCGIEPDRLRMEGHTSLEGYFDWFSRIDLTLDTFPFTGGTTTCHSLYMGVPVVTRSGRTSVSRVGSSILHNVGLGELAADTPERFVQIARELASDLPRLSEIRRTLRERMKQSSLMNEPQFVANLEEAYRQMWRQWVAQEK